MIVLKIQRKIDARKNRYGCLRLPYQVFFGGLWSFPARKKTGSDVTQPGLLNIKRCLCFRQIGAVNEFCDPAALLPLS